MDLISAKIVILLTLLFDGLFFGHLSLMIKVWMEKRKKVQNESDQDKEIEILMNLELAFDLAGRTVAVFSFWHAMARINTFE